MTYLVSFVHLHAKETSIKQVHKIKPIHLLISLETNDGHPLASEALHQRLW